MTISIEDYVNQFKSCVMNHLFSFIPHSLETTYSQIKEDIISQDGRNQELENLELAYKRVHEEISGKQLVSLKE
ncbi:hypothetical protein [Halobacillus sp. Marseille-P3879]|uniref:hypothetical protein n=1 Tax=Halobacillus sp. Marseille-P3879 TaxID=2045014 RepID=UPI000C7D84F7|nr:hypothetical protein [Halobacillus sp. Marseille-P3879]